MKKLLTVLMVSVLVLGSLAAGGDKEEAAASSSSASGGKITLTVWGAQDDQALLKELCNEYAALHPENQYKFLYGVQAETDCADKILNDPESGPDVFSFASDQINKLIQAGALARVGGTILDGITEANSAESMDAASVTVGGETVVYAYPSTGDNTYFLVYDSSELSEDDVKSLDRMLEVASEKGRSIAFKLYDDGWYLSSFFFADEDLKYDVTYSDSLTETKIDINYDSEDGLEVMKALRSYFASPAFSANVDDSKILSGITNGSVIAAVTGTWNMSAIREVWGDDTAVAPLPTATIGGEEVLLNGYFGYKLIGVNGYSQNKGEAHKLAAFLTGEYAQKRRYEARGFGPTNRNVMASEDVQSDDVISVVLEESEYFRTQKGVPTTYWTPMASLTKQFLDADDPMSVSDSDLQALLDSLCSQIRK